MPERGRIFLLNRGGPGVALAGGRAVTMGGPAGALLAILALRAGRDAPREWVAGLLWPDRDAASASRSLTGEIRTVRDAVSEAGLGAVVAELGVLRLDAPADAVDALRFEALAGSGDAAAALDLYQSDLLEGFAAPSVECDHWLTQERARLRNLAITTVEGVMTAQVEAGSKADALASAQRLLTLDPGHEAAHRTAMRMLAETGRRAEAVRQFEACRATLARDYGLEPEAETMALLSLIQDPGIQGPQDGETPPLPALAVERPDPAPLARRRPWLAVAAVMAALVILYLAVGQAGLTVRQVRPADSTRVARPIPDIPSVIITGFAHDAGDSQAGLLAAYIADALAENLLVASGLVVIDAREITRLQSEALSPAKAAETYGVQYFIQGRVHSSGDSVKLSIALIDALAGAYQWEKTYRFPMAEIADLQEQLALDILVELEVELQHGGAPQPHGATSLEAWALASEGLLRLRAFSPEQNRAARVLYERARRLDPAYPGAVGGLGWTYFIEAYFGWTDDRAAALREAGRLGAEAFALDPRRPRTLALLGAVTAFQDPEQGLALAEQAVALAPSSAEEKAILGLLDTYVGNDDRAVELFLQAKRLSVRAPDWFDWGLARALRRVGRYDEAIAVSRASVAKAHRAYSPGAELVLALWQNGDPAAARQEAQTLLRTHPDFTVGGWAAGAPRKAGNGVPEEAALLIEAGLPE